MDKNNHTSSSPLLEIDLIALAGYLWKKRRFFGKCCGIATVVGLIIAFSIPKEFSTTVKLAPETTNATGKMGSLGGLAAMAGIDIGSASGQDALSPNLYPDIVHSTPFLLELFPEKVTDKEKKYTISLYDYMVDRQRSAWWTILVKAPLKGITAFRSLLSDNEENDGRLTPFRLTHKQEEVLKSLRQRITVFVDKKTQVVTLGVDMQDPLISADVAHSIVIKLQTYITHYRTQKAKKDMEFTEKVLKESRSAYYKAQQAYAAFEDSNKNIISASYRTEQERLRNEMTLTFNVYNTLAQKLEQDKLRVQEQMPVYTIIEPATVPLKASSPQKLLILAAFVFLAFIGGCGYLLIKEYANFSPSESEVQDPQKAL